MEHILFVALILILVACGAPPSLVLSPPSTHRSSHQSMRQSQQRERTIHCSMQLPASRRYLDCLGRRTRLPSGSAANGPVRTSGKPFPRPLAQGCFTDFWVAYQALTIHSYHGPPLLEQHRRTTRDLEAASAQAEHRAVLEAGQDVQELVADRQGQQTIQQDIPRPAREVSRCLDLALSASIDL